MLNKRPFYRKVGFWQIAIPALFLMLWLVSLWLEQRSIPDTETLTWIVAGAVLIFLIYFFTALFLAAQFVLPVQTPIERWEVFVRLIRHSLQSHGLAVNIREGEVVANPEELRSYRPGVVFVDTTSAIVLERERYIPRERSYASWFMSENRQRMTRRPRRLGLDNREPYARAAGPGIVFTRAGERLRDVVSLRRQFRVKLKNKAYTRDGFEVAAHVLVIFSLGEPPEVVRVTHVGDLKLENLQSVELGEKQVDRVQNGRTIKKKILFVKSFRTDDIDSADRDEAHRYALSAEPWPEPPRRSTSTLVTPFVFDEKRVFDAVFGGARLLKEDRLEKWTELPVKVAVEIFHNMISVMTYDDLYRPDDPNTFPLATEFRPRFSKAVRNLGVLSFQYIRRRDGQPLEVGWEGEESELEIFQVKPFTNAKILRDRGIRVIAASFPEIHPTNPLVLKQRFETWRARRQGEASISRAPYDAEIIHTYERERALVQQGIIQTLYPTLVDSVASSEVIAHTVLQSLEGFAADPNTHKQLPASTLDLLWSLQNWMPRPELPPGDGGV